MVKKAIKCLSSGCRVFSNFQLEKLLIIPFEDKTNDIRKLLTYFLYRAPDIKTPHKS